MNLRLASGSARLRLTLDEAKALRAAGSLREDYLLPSSSGAVTRMSLLLEIGAGEAKRMACDGEAYRFGVPRESIESVIRAAESLAGKDALAIGHQERLESGDIFAWSVEIDRFSARPDR